MVLRELQLRTQHPSKEINMDYPWEPVVDSEYDRDVERLSVPGGWIYRVSTGLHKAVIIFVPRPNQDSF